MGERIRAERIRAGLSQGELGTLVGVKQQSVAKWEHSGNVSSKRLEAIASALQVPVASLLGPINEVEVDHLRPQSIDIAVDNLLIMLRNVSDELRPVPGASDDVVRRSELERLTANLLAVNANIERATEDVIALLEEYQDDIAPALAEALQRVPEVRSEVARALDESLAALRRERQLLNEQVHLVDEGYGALAAKGADAEGQTVEYRSRPSADTPEEQESL